MIMAQGFLSKAESKKSKITAKQTLRERVSFVVLRRVLCGKLPTQKSPYYFNRPIAQK